MAEIDYILDKALKDLKSGMPADQIVSKYPEHKELLLGLLQTAEPFMRIPTIPAPEPAMRRLYLTAPAKASIWTTWMHFSRFAAVSTSMLLLLAAFGATAYGAINSLPGQRLFAVKRTAEQLELKMTNDPVERANLQLALTQRRMNEARQVFENHNENPALEIAALAELSNQTQQTTAEVKTAALSNLNTAKDHPIVASLQNITKEQQNLLNTIKPDVQAQDAATAAQQANAQTVTEVNKLIQIATVAQDESLTKLNNDPNIVTMSGTVTRADKGSVTIEKTIFYLSAETTTQDEEGNATTSLTSGTLIHIVGKKTNNTIVAREITVLDPANQPAGTVKGTSTSDSNLPTTTPANPASPSASTSTIPLNLKQPAKNTATNTQDTDIQPADGKQTMGGYIIEDPAPQYAP